MPDWNFDFKSEIATIPEAWSPSTANQLIFFKEIISVLFKVVVFF